MVDESNDDVVAQPDYAGVGPYLQNAREKAGKKIEDIAVDTRIPLRHLKAIEAGDFSGLPGKTYATGFVRAYARSLGLDEAEAVAKVRLELDTEDYRAPHQYEAYEPADPARVPPKKLAWTALILGAILMAAYGVWRLGTFGGGDVVVAENQLPVEEMPGSAPVAGSTPAGDVPTLPANAEVVITAKDTVWFRIDDATGKRVHEAQLNAGDRYVVPAGLTGLKIRTSRPQAIDLSVAGQMVPQLGAADTLVKDISLDPAELAKRIGAGAPAGGAATTAPATAAGTAPVSATPED